MASLFSIMLVVILNMIPANVNTFTVETDTNKNIHLTRQDDGTWKAVIMPKNKGYGIYKVEGGKLLAKLTSDKFHTMDFSMLLGINDKTDWKTVKKLNAAGSPLKIERLKNGFNLILSEKGEKEKKTFKIRWEPKKEPKKEAKEDPKEEAKKDPKKESEKEAKASSD